MPATVPPDIAKALQAGGPPPSGLSADERLAYERLDFVYKKGIGYAYQMGLRPQTLYALADSPGGLAAYLLDHDARSYELISRAFAGHPGGPHTRRRPRQHHALLVDEHGDFLGSSLLGKQVQLFRCQKRLHPGCRERLS